MKSAMKERFSLLQVQQDIDIAQNIITLVRDGKVFTAGSYLSLESDQQKIIRAITNGLNIELHKLEKAGKLRGEPSLCQALLIDGVFEAIIYDHSIKEDWMSDTLVTIWVCCTLCPEHHGYFKFKSSSGYAFDRHSKTAKLSRSGSTPSKKKNKPKLIEMCDEHLSDKSKYVKTDVLIEEAIKKTGYRKTRILETLRERKQLINK